MYIIIFSVSFILYKEYKVPKVKFPFLSRDPLFNCVTPSYDLK